MICMNRIDPLQLIDVTPSWFPKLKDSFRNRLQLIAMAESRFLMAVSFPSIIAQNVHII